MAENDRPSDIVEEAFEALRPPPPPEGPSAQAMERVLQAVHQAQERSQRTSLIERIKTMRKAVKYPVAAAFALAVLSVPAFLLLGPHADIAFADVRQRIEQVRTMTLSAVMEGKAAGQPVAMKMKMYFKSPGLMRQEMAVATDPNAATAPAGQNVVSIWNFAKGKGISLIPAQKKATVLELKNVPAELLANAKRQDFLEGLKKAVAGEHEELGTRTIDGRKAQGYRVTSRSGQSTLAMELWADAATGKPIRVEYALPDGMGKVTMTDFALDPVLDDSLFDTTPPKGYTVETQAFDFGAVESDMIKALGLLAKYSGGQFPKSLAPSPELLQRLGMSGISKEEGMEFGSLLSKLIAFRVAMTYAGGEFVYAGEGVKLGDKATAVLWYKAKNGYRVIYGDLHVEDAPAAPKPPATGPANSAPANGPP